MTCVAITSVVNKNIVRISVGCFINYKLSFYGCERKQNRGRKNNLKAIRLGNKLALYCVIDALHIVDQTIIVFFMSVIAIHPQQPLQKPGILTLFQDIAQLVISEVNKPLTRIIIR